MKTKVKSHRRNGRIVRSHFRIYKRNYGSVDYGQYYDLGRKAKEEGLTDFELSEFERLHSSVGRENKIRERREKNWEKKISKPESIVGRMISQKYPHLSKKEISGATKLYGILGDESEGGKDPVRELTRASVQQRKELKQHFKEHKTFEGFKPSEHLKKMWEEMK